MTRCRKKKAFTAFQKDVIRGYCNNKKTSEIAESLNAHTSKVEKERIAAVTKLLSLDFDLWKKMSFTTMPYENSIIKHRERFLEIVEMEDEQ